MAGERTVKVKFTSDERDLIRGAKDVDRALDTVNTALTGMGRAATAASLAVLGAGALIVGQAAHALMEIEKLNAQTTQTIKTMNAAWTNTSEITAYSQKIEKLTGLEAEQVQAAQNLLLTFGNIRNELGAGNDIFNRATSIVADMSIVFGQDMSAAAVQLGKALNDPIKGITALSKVGVSFTEQQKELIRTLVESGDVMGAQKVILDELSREVGGAAEAFGETTAGKVAKFRNELGDLSETLTVALMPALDDWLDRGRSVTAWLIENEGTTKTLANTLAIAAGAVIAINAAAKVYEATVIAVTVATRAWTVAQWALNVAMDANPIGVVILAIGLIITGIGLITMGLEDMGLTWGDVWNIAVGWLKVGWQWVQDIWDKITGFASGVPAMISGAFSSLAAAIANPFIDAFNWIARQWNRTVGALSADIPGVGRVDVPDIPYAARLRWGGNVRAGMPYVVGDGAGPELFVPSTNGRVVPNPADGGDWGGGDTYVAVYVGSEPIAAVARAERVEAGRQTRRWVKASNASTVGGTA